MSKYTNKFEFIGQLVIPKDSEKFFKTSAQDGKYENARLNFGIKKDETNCVFVDCFGSKSDKFKSYSSEENKTIEIPWSKRNEYIDKVASFKKLRANLGGTKKEFITDYDYIEYLKDILPEYARKKIYVSGEFSVREYKGAWISQYKVKYIGETKDSSESSLSLSLDLYFNKDSMDCSKMETEKVIKFSPYLLSYINKDYPSAFIEFPCVLNLAKVDLTNEKMVKAVEVRKKYMTNGKDDYGHMTWLVSVFRGAEAEELTYDQLTEDQKILVDAGLETLRSLSPRAIGNNKVEYRLTRPISDGDFKDGVQNALSKSEFEMSIYNITEDNTTTIEEESVEEENGVITNEDLTGLFD